ncbi:cyclic nucleotide-binding domain-containing protein [Thalassolituus sp. LLYu03]|uniref:cyclic nucleotide-binding domain-containing protein n=1 Tax=Thalassolituus sp. LLYu03 TaxID=3421656 RepID=UPI003D2E3D69
MKKAAGLSRGQVMLVLGKIPFFRSFSPDERERLADESDGFRIAAAGEYVMRAGQSERSFYILLSGGLQVSGGTQGTVLALSPGEVVGEIGFLSGQARTRDVRATEASILLCIDQDLMARMKAEVREKIKDQLILRLLERLLPAKSASEAQAR